jgi:hypothetical protein
MPLYTSNSSLKFLSLQDQSEMEKENSNLKQQQLENNKNNHKLLKFNRSFMIFV